MCCRNQSLTGQIHRVLPTGEAAKPPHGGVPDTQGRSIPLSPDEPLGIGRLELPVLAQIAPVLVDEDLGVVAGHMVTLAGPP